MKQPLVVRPGQESAASRDLHMVTQIGELRLPYPWYIEKIFN
jgi:hypothetical protein